MAERNNLVLYGVKVMASDNTFNTTTNYIGCNFAQ